LICHRRVDRSAWAAAAPRGTAATHLRVIRAARADRGRGGSTTIDVPGRETKPKLAAADRRVASSSDQTINRAEQRSAGGHDRAV